jgi:16S rRNA (adenine1518-N6/adenine1519-N6)-dimethyltransferase
MRLVRPKKFLGQHFLTDQGIASDIADTVDACPDIPVLEVGPGMGVMTQYLVRKPRLVKVVEIDFESVAFLRRHFPSLEDNIIEDDFLKMHLERTFDGKPFVLTGNYPYNISSQIFFKMLDYKDLIPCCTGMIQKEVAERIAARPGNKSYGILSVLIQAWYSVEYLFTVHEHVFNPPPKVKSAVIRMTRNDTSRLGCDERLFRRVVKTTFNQRRKTLRNNIRPLLADLDMQRQTTGIFVPDHSAFLADELFNCRPEQLSVSDFVSLTNRLEEHYVSVQPK